MSEATTKLSELMAALPAASDAAGKSVVLTDANGGMSKIADTAFLPVEIKVTTASACASVDRGAYIGWAYLKSNPRIWCLFSCMTIPYDSAAGNRSPYKTIVSEGGLYIFAVNAFGTIAAKLENGTVPTDVVYCLARFKFDMIFS